MSIKNPAPYTYTTSTDYDQLAKLMPFHVILGFVLKGKEWHPVVFKTNGIEFRIQGAGLFICRSRDEFIETCKNNNVHYIPPTI